MSNESLSALFDGECGDAELDRLLGELESSPALAQRWSRWHLRRELQDGTRVLSGQPCICAAVMAGLEEPVTSGKVVDISGWRRRLVALPWKPAVGLAAAASMGAAAVMFVLPNSIEQGVPEMAQAPDGAPAVKAGNPVSAPSMSRRLQSVSFSGQQTASAAPTFADEEYAELLRDYLASRANNPIPEQGVGPSLRYARFTPHTAEYRPQLVVEDFEGLR